MRTLRVTTRLLVLPLCLAGCASTSGVSSKMRTVASVGDKPLPVVTGGPGALVRTDQDSPPRTKRAAGRISGRVVDEHGEPVENVRVRLAVGGTSGGKVVNAKTDRTGAFTLRGVRPGTKYTVIAEWADGPEVMSGRSEVQAPDTDVRISLGPSEAEPTAVKTTSKARVNRVSDREEAADDPEPPARDREKPRLNDEDLLPPAPEAESLAAPKVSRARTSRPVSATSRSARWRRGEPDRATSQAQGTRDEAESSPAPLDTEARETSARRVKPPAAEFEDDGPNPLPPALEPGQESHAPGDEARSSPGRRDAEAFASFENSHAREPDPSIFESDSAAPTAPRTARRDAGSDPDVFESAADSMDLETLARVQPAASTRRASKPGGPGTKVSPTLADPPATPPGALAAVAGTAPTELPPDPDRPAAPEAGTRRRLTWKELEPNPGAAAPASALAGSPPAPSGRPRAGPQPVDDRKVYCEYDAKHRRMIDFRLPDLEGRPVRFQELDADLVLVDFWGTWCQPCVRSVPHLVDLQKRFGTQKLRVVGIACEQGPPESQARTVAKEVRRLGINYPVLLSGRDGPCPLQEALHIQAFPTLILLDRQGRIVWRDQGATPVTLARLDRFLTSAASKPDDVRRY